MHHDRRGGGREGGREGELELSCAPPRLMHFFQFEQAEKFIQWLCSVGAPGSVIEGAIIENQTRGEQRQFQNFDLSNS